MRAITFSFYATSVSKKTKVNSPNKHKRPALKQKYRFCLFGQQTIPLNVESLNITKPKISLQEKENKICDISFISKEYTRHM